jgi:hypothetical protein
LVVVVVVLLVIVMFAFSLIAAKMALFIFNFQKSCFVAAT